MLPPWWLTPPPPTRITDPTGYLDLGVFLTPEDRAQQQRAIAKELSELGYSPHEVEEYEGACELANATKALPLKTGMGSLGDGWPGKSSGVVRERQCVWVFVGRKPGGK